MASSRRAPVAAPATLPAVATESILESISDGVFTVDKDWRITFFNRAAEEITGVARHEAVGRYCSDVFRASMCESNCALRQTLATGAAAVNRATFIVNGDGKRMPISVSTAILRDQKGHVIGGAETFRDLSLVEELRKEIQGRSQVGDIVTRSASMRRVLDVLPRIAVSESTILLRGETGTGKELVARAIHSLSTRSKGPFVAVNCGALPDSLLESELFGYKAGAFTGASKDKPGRFALARGGTLFLDEIGEISPALQVKLLRVLQERLYEPLGATRSEEANVRIIVATHRDLAAQVEHRIFRQDLYYRINVMKVELPPLRDRREDIPLLSAHFITLFNALQNKRVSGIRPDALAILSAHDYPGNVRELQNIIEHAFVLVQEGEIQLKHLPSDIVPTAMPRIGKQRMKQAVTLVETQAIREALEHSGGNRIVAAKQLGIHKSTLFRRIKHLGIALPEHDGRSRNSADAKDQSRRTATVRKAATSSRSRASPRPQ